MSKNSSQETSSETAEKAIEKSSAKDLINVSGQLTKDTVKALQKRLDVTVTGVLDRATVTELQGLAGVEEDGFISNQNLPWSMLPSHSNIAQEVWRFTGSFANSQGDLAFRFLQSRLGAPVTGQLDSDTVRAIQKWLNEGGDLI